MQINNFIVIEQNRHHFLHSSLFRGGGGVLPYKRLMGICRWMGSHFYDWSDWNWVAHSRIFGVSSRRDSKWEDSRLKKSES